MKMKRFLLLCVSMMLLGMFTPPLLAGTAVDGDDIVIEDLKTEADFEAAFEVLKDRVTLLKAEKKAATTFQQKKEIKQQIKKVKEEVKAVKQAAASGGIYIGSGVLIVVLLLILLL